MVSDCWRGWFHNKLTKWPPLNIALEFNIYSQQNVLEGFFPLHWPENLLIGISARQLSCTLVNTLLRHIHCRYAFTYQEWLLLSKSPTFICNLVYCAFLFVVFCTPVSKFPTTVSDGFKCLFRLSRTFLLSSPASWTNNCIKIGCTWSYFKVNYNYYSWKIIRQRR